MRDCKTCVDYGNCTVDDIASCAHGDNIGHSDYRPKTNEYIKREVAINRIRKVANMMGFENPAVAIDCTISVLENTPAADVIPVRHGRWIAPFLSSGGNICAECSHCHKIRIIDDYCSACGTIMDLEDMED